VPESAAVARSQLRSLLQGVVNEQVSEDVQLAVTELVTNVVRHAGVSARDEIQLIVRIDDERLRVAVRQPTTAIDALVVSRDQDLTGGWGLMIVDRITDHWGIEPGPPGEVWFEVRLDRQLQDNDSER
jgi:sigma-B regulation protein RsbU (phosphoserine phosphatase)